MISQSSLGTFKKKQAYQFIFEQDAIVSGIQYTQDLITSLLESDKDPKGLECFYNFKDGDCILQGQTCLEIFQPSTSPLNLQDIVQIIGYLSGISTLTRCYVEATRSVSIVGSTSENLALSHWESEAIKQGGGLLSPSLPQQVCSIKNNLHLFLKDPVIALSTKFPEEELKKVFKQIPSSTQVGIYGDLLPQDIKKWEAYPIHLIWPTHLQAKFPPVKIALNTSP